MKFVFFDVANTLLHKPGIWVGWSDALEKNGVTLNLGRLKKHHKMLSEAIAFPPKTSNEFYQEFNTQVLLSLGIIPTQKLLDDIFEACTYLPWEPFEDLSFISRIKAEMGIISNWDTSLQDKLQPLGLSFSPIIGSAETGFSKPDIRIFEAALKHIDQADFSEVIFVGDSIKLDIIPAMNAGLNAVLIDRENFYPDFSGPRMTSFEELTDWV